MTKLLDWEVSDESIAGYSSISGIRYSEEPSTSRKEARNLNLVLTLM
jgi:hypothetical protein